ncbi:unnamed protein product [Strongylus vulgaris]|uniref:Uncharacterized protein n=1 Tax=Strongylus vulgaris TaxID=40348 RepID=A0A3P7JCV3_STRVU|nr:unnamed protein product [Strongylus vulgaris]
MLFFTINSFKKPHRQPSWINLLSQTDNLPNLPIISTNFRYFSSSNDESRTRCEDECEEVYFSFFTYGKCVGDIFGRLPKDQQPACNLRCGVRPRLWTSIGLFCVFAASLATLLFTIPMCIATCASCLHAKKANKNAKRVIMEQQQGPNKDQQIATMGYNPYAYWPYYGRA